LVAKTFFLNLIKIKKLPFGRLVSVRFFSTSAALPLGVGKEEKEVSILLNYFHEGEVYTKTP
jgi:hypothetical protein